MSTVYASYAYAWSIEEALRNYFLLWGGALVFSMQCGFCMLEVGCVRYKNTRNILVKNILDACIGAIFYWAFGYGLAYGYASSTDDDDESNIKFVGNSGFFYSAVPNSGTYGAANFGGWAHFFFNFTFVAAAGSIVSGAVAERCAMPAYFLYTSFLTGFVYPIVSHWVWATPGWLCAWQTNPDGTSDLISSTGAIDFAGSGVVHLTGAVAAFWGAYFVGPRTGRVQEVVADGQKVAKFVKITGQNATMQVLGTFFLWIGWYGFNAGTMFTWASTASYYSAAGRIAITTTLSAASSCISSMMFAYMLNPGVYDLDAINNGVLGGLVSITAGCATMAPWAAVLTGLIGGIVYHLGSWIQIGLGVDDVVDAIAVHGYCGIWGLLATGIFSRSEEMMEVYGMEKAGIFMPNPGNDGGIIGANIVLTVVVIAWTSVFMGAFFGICSAFGILRVSEQEERDGLDNSHHGGPASGEDSGNIAMVEKSLVPTQEA
jgi:Amt family ammonium transporter